jgi:pSer/pThr/pTyr-binding forkhead associated (FHA) protein
MSGLVVEVLFKGKVLQRVPFDRGTLRFGRMRENEIVIDNLSVSRFHGRLQLVDGHVFLEDNGSENGTFVSGTRIHGRVEIRPGDAIAVGKHQLRVRSDVAPGEVPVPPPPARPSDAWDGAKTYFAGPETRIQLGADANQPASPRARGDAPAPEKPTAAAPAPEKPAAAAPAAPSARSQERPAMQSRKPERPELEIGRVGDSVFDLAGPDEAEPIELSAEPEDMLVPPAASAPETATIELGDTASPEIAGPQGSAPLYAGLIVQREGRIERVVAWNDDLLTVGRSADCDLVLSQDEVSRRHAQLRRASDRYEVHDLGSVNGTLVNGRRVDQRVLEVGDVIAIEGYQLTFVLDRQPLDGVMKPAAAAPSAQPEDANGMTILQEELPKRSGFAIPSPAQASAAPLAEATAVMPAESTAALPVESIDAQPAESMEAELDLVEAVELDEESDGAIDDRKELATVRPRGSSRASSLQDLGPVQAGARTLTLELRLRLEELPEPLRRAFADAALEEIELPVELRLRTSR